MTCSGGIRAVVCQRTPWRCHCSQVLWGSWLLLDVIDVCVFSLFLNLGHTDCSFQVLIGILQRRIELDKEVMCNNNNKLNIITMIFNRQVLFQFTTIKRETALVDKDDKNPTIAPTLMKFQRGCHQVRNCFLVMLRTSAKELCGVCFRQNRVSIPFWHEQTDEKSNSCQAPSLSGWS